MKAGARSVAVSLLERVFRPAATLDRVFESRIFKELPPRDRRLTTELVYGVLRNLLRVDFYLRRLSDRPLEKLDSSVLWILRVALYQIEFLHVPDHAAVNEAVEDCRHFRKSSAAGFVNAVLRAFQRERPEVPLDPSPASLSIRTSHPEWLVRRYLDRFGLEKTTSLLERNNLPHLPAVWVNPFRTSVKDFCRQLEDEGIPCEVLPFPPNCVVVHGEGFIEHPLYREGACFFMDVASQEVVTLARLDGARLLGDFCVAPGGKAFVLAFRRERGSRLVGCDLSFERLLQVRRRAGLYGIPGLELLCADLGRPSPFRVFFDFILLDVPCSGLGTVRSNPDIRWKVREKELARFQKKQLALLQSGFASLEPGRDLLYVTCSTEPEENEQVVQEFLAEEKRALLWGDYFRTFPDPHPGQGFFAACIRKGS